MTDCTPGPHQRPGTLSLGWSGTAPAPPVEMDPHHHAVHPGTRVETQFPSYLGRWQQEGACQLWRPQTCSSTTGPNPPSCEHRMLYRPLKNRKLQWKMSRSSRRGERLHTCSGCSWQAARGSRQRASTDPLPKRQAVPRHPESGSSCPQDVTVLRSSKCRYNCSAGNSGASTDVFCGPKASTQNALHPQKGLGGGAGRKRRLDRS